MRLIDADKLKLSLCRECSLFPDECLEKNGECDWNSIAHINMMKPVDAVPVRHGKWLPENRTMDAYWVCSCCGFPSEAHGAFKIYKYCPECGARMDEE